MNTNCSNCPHPIDCASDMIPDTFLCPTDDANPQWTPRHTPHRGGDDIWCIDWSKDQEEVAEIVHGKENAFLMAAAPKLLAALKHAKVYVELWKNQWDEKYPGRWNGNYFDAMQQIEAAIAIAEVSQSAQQAARGGQSERT